MTSQDHLHISHWNHFCNDDHQSSIYSTWWDPHTVNHWRHERFLEMPLQIFKDPMFKNASWLTVGDGSGHDTWILKGAGYTDILTTDIGIGTLRRTLEFGHIEKFEQANAENLHFIDNAFDFVLCKETLHHMHRPYAAIYEMLRVARYGVVIIEPQDQFIDLPCLPPPYKAGYESVGNFVYSFSKIELQKVAYGLNLPLVTTKPMIDVYIEGCEFQKKEPGNPFFVTLENDIKENEVKAQNGEVKWNYIKALFVKRLGPFFNEAFLQELKISGWEITKTNTNPKLSGRSPYEEI
jgi:ubiquinone/menaquinone biosynthesis C-methylase UbiE